VSETSCMIHQKSVTGSQGRERNDRNGVEEVRRVSVRICGN